ncbi:MAG: hypothetical protein LBD74_07335 [Spirochaetaceae bacterium]|nr:hypothetical protein [Spirochaetaceae bacterium]
MRMLLFLCEFFRLILLLSVLAVLGPLYGVSGGGGLTNQLFPYIVCLVPNALFPLMTYFLWIRLSLYHSYLPLYIAGKIITLVALMGWLVFSFRGIITALNTGARGISGFILILTAADIFSVIGGLLLQTKISQMNRLAAQGEGGL